VTDNTARSPLPLAEPEADTLEPDCAPDNETATGNETGPPRIRRPKLSIRYRADDLATDL
jgi:hypothetical protein